MKRNVLGVTLAAAAFVGFASLAGQVLADNPRPEGLAPLDEPPIPADNPMSDAKVELGKMLFFDRILSGNNAMPCSACHLPEAG